MFTTELPGEKRSECRRKKNLCESLSTAMGQVLPLLKDVTPKRCRFHLKHWHHPLWCCNHRVKHPSQGLLLQASEVIATYPPKRSLHPFPSLRITITMEERSLRPGDTEIRAIEGVESAKAPPPNGNPFSHEITTPSQGNLYEFMHCNRNCKEHLIRSVKLSHSSPRLESQQIMAAGTDVTRG